MSKERILLILGLWVAVLPYLGFPYSWKQILFSLTGLGIAYMGYKFFHEKNTDSSEETFENFSENTEWIPREEENN